MFISLIYSKLNYMPSLIDYKAQNDPTPMQIRLRSTFDAYTFFKSLPYHLRYPPQDKKTGYRPAAREFAIALGIEDENLLTLIELRTQKRFAEYFGVTEQTLGRWNNLITETSTFSNTQKWAQSLTPNVVLSLYSQVLQGRALPQHYKLWFQVIDGWSEKQAVAPSRTISTVSIEVVKSPVS
jgi:hypothetical protein